jgi:hypothetical protein
MRSYGPALFIILSLATASLCPAAGSVEEGMEMIRQGRYQEAIGALRQARTLSPLTPG